MKINQQVNTKDFFSFTVNVANVVRYSKRCNKRLLSMAQNLYQIYHESVDANISIS